MDTHFNSLPVELTTQIVSYLTDKGSILSISEITEVDYIHLFLLNLKCWYRQDIKKNPHEYDIKNIYVNLLHFQQEGLTFVEDDIYDIIYALDKETLRYSFNFIKDNTNRIIVISHLDSVRMFRNHQFNFYDFKYLFEYNSYRILKYIMKDNMLKGYLLPILARDNTLLKNLFGDHKFSAKRRLRTFKLLMKYKMLDTDNLIEILSLTTAISKDSHDDIKIIKVISKHLKSTAISELNSYDTLMIDLLYNIYITELSFYIFKIVYENCKHLLGRSVSSLYEKILESLTNSYIMPNDPKILVLLANNEYCREHYL